MAQYLIGDQVTCRLGSSHGFTDADFASDDGIVAYLQATTQVATGPVPTIEKAPPTPAATTTYEPYGVLANRVPSYGTPTASAGSNQLTYIDAANVTVSGIVPVTLASGRSGSVGQQLGNVQTIPAAPTTDGLQGVASGGKGRIVATNGQVVYWDIRAK